MKEFFFKAWEMFDSHCSFRQKLKSLLLGIFSSLSKVFFFTGNFLLRYHRGRFHHLIRRQWGTRSDWRRRCPRHSTSSRRRSRLASSSSLRLGSSDSSPQRIRRTCVNQVSHSFKHVQLEKCRQKKGKSKFWIFFTDYVSTWLFQVTENSINNAQSNKTKVIHVYLKMTIIPGWCLKLWGQLPSITFRRLAIHPKVCQSLFSLDSGLVEVFSLREEGDLGLEKSSLILNLKITLKHISNCVKNFLLCLIILVAENGIKTKCNKKGVFSIRLDLKILTVILI